MHRLSAKQSDDLPASDGTGPVAGWLQSPLTFVLLCVLGALPVVFAAMPPLTDLGGHLGRFAVQLDGGASSSLQQWYSFRWNLIPNLGTDLLVQLLAPSLGLEPALKLIVVAIPALQIAGWLLLARAVHGHVPPTALFALPLAYGYPFQFGFLNFTLAAGLATCLLALWIALGNRDRAEGKGLWLRWVIFVPLSCALWIAHLVGWALFCVFAGADEFWQRRAKGEELGRAVLGSVLSLSCLLAPWLLKLFWPAPPTGHGETSELFRVVSKLGYLIMPLRDRWEVWDIGSALIIIGMIGWSWKSLGFTQRGGLALGTACLAGLFCIMPGQALGSHYADMRLLPTVLAMALIAARPNAHTASRVVHRLALIGLVFAVARILGNGASMALLDHQFSADLVMLDAVPRDTQLVSLVLDRCDKTWGPWPRERRNHLDGYAIARRHDFSNDQWLIPGGQLLEVHNADAGEFTSDPSQLTHALACKGKPGVVQVVERVPLAVRYLWIMENGVPHQLAGWHPIRTSLGSVLYTRN